MLLSCFRFLTAFHSFLVGCIVCIRGVKLTLLDFHLREGKKKTEQNMKTKKIEY